MKEIKCLRCSNPAKNKFCSRVCYYENKKINTYPGQFTKGHIGIRDELHKMFNSNAGYTALHEWLYIRLGKPRLCENCGATDKKKYEWANISDKYFRDITDWARLCTSCHRLFDGHSYKMWATRRMKNA